MPERDAGRHSINRFKTTGLSGIAASQDVNGNIERTDTVMLITSESGADNP